MTRTDLALLVIGAALVVGGVALVHVPSALIVAGLAVLAVGLLRNVNQPTQHSQDSEERR